MVAKLNINQNRTGNLSCFLNREKAGLADVKQTKKHLVKKGNDIFLCLIKGNDEKAEKFENDLLNCNNFTTYFKI